MAKTVNPNGPSEIWEYFEPTVILSGLIVLTGSSFNNLCMKKYSRVPNRHAARFLISRMIFQPTQPY